MSSIVLSASVRQNLLSLQSTADLLAITQTRLSSGRRVNSALDNPTNYFTASALDGRASDLNNLLDSIGNGVQVLQAANTGITSLQTLVSNAKSVTNQALQTQVGFSTKSTVTSAAVTGASANNLLGDFVSAAKASSAAVNNVLNTPAAITGNTVLVGAVNSDSVLTTGLTTADSITVNGTAITFTTAASGTSDATHVRLDENLTSLLGKIDAIQGGTGSAIASGIVTVNTGAAADLNITGTTGGYALLAALKLTTGTTPVIQARDNQVSSGLTLTIAATGGGTATSITFGTAANQVNTLDELNAALASNNLLATVSSAGAITISTSNDAASSTIGAIGGTVTNSGEAFNGKTASAPVQDVAALQNRASLVTQYNNIIRQITNIAQDASFGGVNLLGGDTLKLVFNETGKSALNITGVNFNPAGLGLSNLAAGTDFVDNNATNRVLASLNDATVTLRSQASSLGSNLSIVQIRQDFSKSLIIVLRNGSDNLTLTDTNEEAANSQALSTRQSIAVSALGLANQSQQGVLQLLR